MRTVLITGSSSGIGRAAAALFVERGWNVAASMRDPRTSDLGRPNLLTVALDVTDRASVNSAVHAVVDRFGAIDLVVNNAGFALMGPFEGATAEQIRRQFDTNVFGLMNVVGAVLPHMRQRRAGTIINISSMGGLLTFPYYSIYHSTKWAVEGFSESLQFEVEPFGIRVKVVEPGAVKTDFYGRSADVTSSPPYDASWTRAKVRMDREGASGTTPERVAAVIYRAATDRSKRLRYPVNGKFLVVRRIAGYRGWHAIVRASVMR